MSAITPFADHKDRITPLTRKEVALNLIQSEIISSKSELKKRKKQMSQISDKKIEQESSYYLGMIKASPDMWYIFYAAIVFKSEPKVESVGLNSLFSSMRS